MIASVPSGKGIEGLFGTRDENMRLIELALHVTTRLANGSIDCRLDTGVDCTACRRGSIQAAP